MKEEISDWFKTLQSDICIALERADGGAVFETDNWNRPGGGGGRTRVIQDGNIIEKGGVNFSAVSGETPEKIKQALDLEASQFFATGVSIVLHPKNPWVPIIHMNVRYFELNDGTYWFGGGIDLTPHYIINDDAQFFHKKLKAVCDHSDTDYYPRYKRWADDYFFIKHRQETRGIGGIFFDRLTGKTEGDFKHHWHFVQSVGSEFAPIYTELMSRNANKSFSQDEKNWQMLRRGRYVEFNLVLDKGTKFGLDTNGRIESILMSLPPHASWEYDQQPEKGSKEAETIALLVKNHDWIKNA